MLVIKKKMPQAQTLRSCQARTASADFEQVPATDLPPHIASMGEKERKDRKTILDGGGDWLEATIEALGRSRSFSCSTVSVMSDVS